MTTSSNKPTVFFWIISILAFLWNISGVYAYLSQAYMTDEVLSTLPELEQLYLKNVASWATAAFATAVFSGLLGAILMIIRKKLAKLFFIISLIAVLIQAVYNFIIQEYMPLETAQIFWSLVIILIALFLVIFSDKAIKKQYLS